MRLEIEKCDVLVIGGRPAGSTVCTLLAERGGRLFSWEKIGILGIILGNHYFL